MLLATKKVFDRNASDIFADYQKTKESYEKEEDVVSEQFYNNIS